MTLTVRVAARELAELKAGRVPESFLLKLEKAEMLKGAKKGLDPRTAVEAFREVLGDRLVAPLGSVWGELGGRLRRLGLSRMDCVTIAKVAKEQWRRGPIKAESLVRQAEVLLAAAQQDFKFYQEPNSWQGAVGVDE